MSVTPPHATRARCVHAGAGDFGTYKTHKSRGLLVALVLLSLVRLGYFQRLYREYRHMITVSFTTIDSCRMIFMVSEHCRRRPGGTATTVIVRLTLTIDAPRA